MSSVQSRLLEMTAAHIRLLTELDEVLGAETDALAARQLVPLREATDRKNELLGQLEGLGQQFSALCKEGGIEPRNGHLIGAEVTAVMADAWSRMCRLLENCQQKNRMNGITINASRNFAENLLALLQGQTPTKTYGKSGTVYRDSNVTALGSA